MDSLLQQLENNEAILLMYLADELPASDRVAVEQMLKNDANLAAELESLRRTQAGLEQSLRRADAGQPLPISQQAANRQVMRLVNQWVNQKLAREAAPKPMVIVAHARRWWLYPIAAAAVLLLGFIFFTSYHEPREKLMTHAESVPETQPAPVPEPRLPQLPSPDETQPTVATDNDMTKALAEVQAVESFAPNEARQDNDQKMVTVVTGTAVDYADLGMDTAPTTHEP